MHPNPPKQKEATSIDQAKDTKLEDVKLSMGPCCRQYKSIACFFFPWLPKCSGTIVFGDDQTHPDAAQIKILCLIIHTLGM